MSMYPDIGAALDETQGTSLTLKYPSKFKITMEYGKFSDAGGVEFGDTNPVATGLLPCFLQSFDAVYNPNAMAFHSDGNLTLKTFALATPPLDETKLLN
mgnify:CR=1 FL=1